jgi:hypothetical protein
MGKMRMPGLWRKGAAYDPHLAPQQQLDPAAPLHPSAKPVYD